MELFIFANQKKSVAGMKNIFIFIFIIITTSISPAQEKSLTDLTDGFVDIKEIAPTIIVDMRYYTEHNFVGTQVDGYNSPRCILTREAAEALSKVQAELLTFGMSLKVYDAYRPQKAVDHFVRWAKDMTDTLTKREFYPEVSKKNLFRDGYIAYKSSHSRGSACDVSIVLLPDKGQADYDRNNQVKCTEPVGKRYGDNSIDMGTGFDCFCELSHTANPDITTQQKIHRLLLKSLMEKYGFENYEKEWWHFTLKNEPYPDTYFDFDIN